MPPLFTLNLSTRTRAGAFYFVFLASTGTIGPFLYLAYRQHGLTPSQIGIAIAVAHLTSFLAAPLWGAASDVAAGRRGMPLLAVACFGAAPAILLLQVVRGLVPTLFVIVLWSAFGGSIFAQADSGTLALLGQEKHRYGRIRAWGSIGFVVATLIVGQLGARLGVDILFPACALLLGVGGLLALAFPPGTARPGVALGGAAWRLVRQPPVALLFLSFLLFSMANMAWFGTLSLYLTDMGAGTGLLGGVLSAGSLVEIPVVFLSAGWLRAWESNAGSQSLLVGLCSYG